MTQKLRLGRLPKVETVRLTITLPAEVKTDLDRYAELYSASYGEAVDAAVLVPHMLATFMERDRAFRKAAHSAPADTRDRQTATLRSAAIDTVADAAKDFIVEPK